MRAWYASRVDMARPGNYANVIAALRAQISRDIGPQSG
jgi:hypothetical protein